MRRPVHFTIGSVCARFPRFRTGSRSRAQHEYISQQIDLNPKRRIMPLTQLDPHAVHVAIDLQKKHPGLSPVTLSARSSGARAFRDKGLPIVE
jgi:hypothetical protein